MLERGLEFAARGNHVSLNLSARTLADPDLAERVAGELARTGARPEHVTFEFTETAAVSSIEDAHALTDALCALGCSVALDDFGTGFGTFVLLKHLPVTALKIDTEFVRRALHLAGRPADRARDRADRRRGRDGHGGRGRRRTPGRWRCCANTGSTTPRATTSPAPGRCPE